MCETIRSLGDPVRGHLRVHRPYRLAVGGSCREWAARLGFLWRGTMRAIGALREAEEPDHTSKVPVYSHYVGTNVASFDIANNIFVATDIDNDEILLKKFT